MLQLIIARNHESIVMSLKISLLISQIFLKYDSQILSRIEIKLSKCVRSINNQSESENN